MVALARSVSVNNVTFSKGTDSSAIPGWARDKIRNPKNWVGGVAPPLVGEPVGDPVELSGLTAAQARAALGIGDNAGGGGGGGAVASVNAKTGVVVLDADDLAEGSVHKLLTPDERSKVAGALPKSGGTITGNLTVGDGVNSSSLTVASSRAGGDDSSKPGTFDSTGRLVLSSYQRANDHSYGEVLRIYSRHSNSKQMIAWYGPTAYTPWDRATDTGGAPIGGDHGWFWMGAHYGANDASDPTQVHGHWSMETPDAAGMLRTRLGVHLWNPETGAYGLDKTFWITNQADFVVRGGNNQRLRIAGAGSTDRSLEYATDDYGKKPLWRIRTDSTTVSTDGSNTGSNLEFVRFSDAGTEIDTPLRISRTSGYAQVATRVGIPSVPAATYRLDIVETATGGTGVVRFSRTETGNTNPIIFVTGGDTTAGALTASVVGDASNRFKIATDGKTEWGSGAAARDTNLYRSAADTLKTDDSLITALRLTVGNAALQSPVIYAETIGDRNGLQVKATAVGTASTSVMSVETNDVTKRAFDYRLTGDAVARLRLDASLGGGGATLIFGNGAAADTNLYRSTAAVLKTDQSFHIGATLSHLGSSLGFYGATPAAKPTITGSRGGNAALADLLTKMATIGLITDSTTA